MFNTLSDYFGTGQFAGLLRAPQYQQNLLANSLQQASPAQMLAHAQAVEVYRADHATGVKEMRRRWAEPQIERGYLILERVAFWSAVPVIGKVVNSSLADRLDRISADLEAVNG